jgi:hypothetical protein
MVQEPHHVAYQNPELVEGSGINESLDQADASVGSPTSPLHLKKYAPGLTCLPAGRAKRAEQPHHYSIFVYCPQGHFPQKGGNFIESS